MVKMQYVVLTFDAFTWIISISGKSTIKRSYRSGCIDCVMKKQCSGYIIKYDKNETHSANRGLNDCYDMFRRGFFSLKYITLEKVILFSSQEYNSR